jgi:hypothetical protein
MHGLANEWLAMLDLLREHPMTAHASRLTDKDFADVIANMTEKRADKTDRLIRLLIPESGNGQGRNTSVGPDPDRCAEEVVRATPGSGWCRMRSADGVRFVKSRREGRWRRS